MLPLITFTNLHLLLAQVGSVEQLKFHLLLSRLFCPCPVEATIALPLADDGTPRDAVVRDELWLQA